MSWEAVIGLEIHVQLKTASKLFCHCSTTFGGQPNTNACPVCTGMPGVLPVLNKQVVASAIQLGLATHCQIRQKNEFARKNYFYPDLPKGYQISQFDKPICEKGYMDVQVGDSVRRVGITRIHMEEDAGKLVHAGSENIKGATYSLSDLNRSSVPLLEVVSEPDIRSGEEARVYAEKIRQIVRYLDIGDGNMEEGSLRCDANISIRQKGATELGTKTEVKNLNSFKAVEKAIHLEIERQIDILEEGGTIIQETRHYNEATQSTKSLRSKEEAHDYRYFPDPDLVPLDLEQKWIDELKSILPELPTEKTQRFQNEYGLNSYDAEVITVDRSMAELFEEATKLGASPKDVANWLMGDITGYLNQQHCALSETKMTAQKLADLLTLIQKSVISGKIAKQLLPDLLESDENPNALIEKKGLVQISDEGALVTVIQEVIQENPGPADEIRGGKMQTLGFLMGQVMKKTQGKANPQLVQKILKQKLGL